MRLPMRYNRARYLYFVKKQVKAVILFAFMGGIMVTSGVVIAIPGIAPQGGSPDTQDPADPSATDTTGTQTEQFCGTGEPQSGTYVKEYRIPSKCTQPLAIATDDAGQVWFAQTAAGRVAKFNPVSERFIEYSNTLWPEGGRSMMWGMDYDGNGNIWYTDATYSSVWRFSTTDQEYLRVPYPSNAESPLPQRLVVMGDEIVVNDFQGSKITFLSSDLSRSNVAYRDLPSPVPNSLTGGFDVDSSNNLWYTNWVYLQSGVLVKFDQDRASSAIAQNVTAISDSITLYPLPPGLTTPNGLTVDGNDAVWIADTSSSYFFRFDPGSEDFTRYVTSIPPPSTYGNASGLIHSTVTRPYWTALDDQGRLVFNEQTGNRIAVFDPRDESLVEYLVPSKNPHWGDCGDMPDCGLAQVFGFTVSGDKIWFTEWVENNIGVVDTSVALPFQVDVVSDAARARSGESVEIVVQIAPAPGYAGDIRVSVGNPSAGELDLSYGEYVRGSDGTVIVTANISADASGGTYKVLVGAQNDEIAVSKYFTLSVPPQVL